MSASLAVAVFVLTINVGVFLTPYLVRSFSENKISDLVIKRSLIVIGLYLMMFNSAIMMTIVDAATLPLKQEMVRYMWLFGIFGWVSIISLVWKTIKDIIKLWQKQKEQLNFEVK